MAQQATAAQVHNAPAEASGANGPVRTCIGCRKTAARSQLIRLVRSNDGSAEAEAKVDLQARMPGRGAWLHPQAECWQLAIKRRAIGRALPGVSNVKGVELFAQEGLHQQAL